MKKIIPDNFKNGQNLVLFLEISITKISSAVASFLVWRFLFIFTISSFVRCFVRNCFYTILCLSIISENENIKKVFIKCFWVKNGQENNGFTSHTRILKSVAAIYVSTFPWNSKFHIHLHHLDIRSFLHLCQNNNNH